MKSSQLIAIVVILLILAGGIFFFMNRQSGGQSEQMTQNSESLPTASSTDMAQTSESSPSSEASSSAVAGVKEFTVEGSNFKFSPSEITVSKGDTVRITFKNTSGFHDFTLPDFNVKTNQIQGGQSQTVEFVANKAGTFEYYCSVANHRQMGMKGNLIVQ